MLYLNFSISFGIVSMDKFINNQINKIEKELDKDYFNYFIKNKLKLEKLGSSDFSFIFKKGVIKNLFALKVLDVFHFLTRTPEKIKFLTQLYLRFLRNGKLKKNSIWL